MKKGRSRKGQASAVAEGGGEAVVVSIPWQSSWPMLGVFILGGVVLMILAAQRELWFDEVFSFQWARAAQNPWQLVTVYRHDNNHPLLSLWLLVVGDEQQEFVYRLPSIAAGLGGLVLLAVLARDLVPRAAWVPVLLAAVSYPLLLFFSEARGYGMALFFTLAAWMLLGRRFARARWFDLGGFYFLCGAGLLAHGTFIFPLVAMGVWSVTQVFREPRPFWRRMLLVGQWWVVPTLFVAVFYWFYLREMLVAGGPEYSRWEVVGHWFGYALGGPSAGIGAVFSVVVGMMVAIAGLEILRRKGRPETVFLAAVVLGVPFIAVVLHQGEALYFRYILLGMPFFYLLVGVAMSKMWSSRVSFAPILAWVFLISVLAGQMGRIFPLLNEGRGQYVAALELLAARNQEETVVVSNNDLRTGLVFLFYAKRLGLENALRYQPQWAQSKAEADWLILDRQAGDPAAVSLVETPMGAFQLEEQFRSAPVSGVEWIVYRRVAGNEPPP